ncbi:MAG TPA: transposase, partial [Fimbriiglobus sp.]|nr:transposase [Fimbriiglobus sp.]
GFYWQNGYGAFSVSPSNAEQVTAYIANQEEHHRARTFQDEFRGLLRRHKIEWDERYVWD